MAKLCKLVIGVKPAKRMFRITSLSGEIVDGLIESVDEKNLPDDYYTKVARSPDGSSIRLVDDKGTNALTIDTENIIFVKDGYEDQARVNIDECLSEFQQIWDACQVVLKVRNIRRIGMVGEYRIIPSSSNASAALLRSLTKFERSGHVAKFAMQFETHALTTGAAGLPDVKTSDFWNTIETYFDSVLDSQHSDEGQITAMLDVQRYYAPFLNGNIPDETRKLRKRYDEATKQLNERLTKLGLIHGTEKE